MKTIKYRFLILIITLPALLWAEDRYEHKLVAGYNLGATAPSNIPEEIRKIEGWWPQFTPRLGYNATYKINNNWFAGSGIMLDYKGMGTRVRAKYIHTRVRLEKGGEELEGYFVGKNETRVKLAYVTVPFFVGYNINRNWSIRAGGYASYAFSTSFKGSVYDGYLRTPTPTGKKIEFTGDDEATFDFGDDIRTFDFGFNLGAEYRVNERFGIFGNLDWGIRPIFPKKFRAMDFNMYNIYFSVGLTYQLQKT
ncbi:hypothetical protein M2132_000568 [Dysgonomonas sp. PH5-45]|uniref:porin family protein n=1 Tax=unclassified Dysgonomonas TaxID=2630389 RepID=UPI00247310E9|nr:MULTISPECIES: porin family protein [unclassified Dysgonomonas]MDH6354241.1 hypothetical protein [Dysgonomonas sp. PH5-45]MDH6387142.1 hypothetical protein [Dysgonomonas sp. PH5-37]